MTARPIPLRASALASLDAARVRVPPYDRASLREGIVHIGVGGFHRAHLAVYIDTLLRAGAAAEWAICGVGLLPADRAIYDVLRSQDHLYALVERSEKGETAQIVGSITSFLFAPEDPSAVVAKLAAPSTKIVSLTITESGYFVNEARGTLDVDHPDIAYDLSRAESDAPRTTYGYLTAALAERRRAGAAPFTVVSCDNVQKNGDLVRAMLLAFVERRDPPVATWLRELGAFPNSMVDRITPRTTDADRQKLAIDFGIEDGWPVVTEPFLQWVIEDRFACGRPPWETVGVQMVDVVEPYELMKLRLLNASHSAMGYLGYLAGFETINEVIGDPDFARFIRRIMREEVTPLLPPVPGIDLDAYCETLVRRFANPTIKDQVTRICMDGSGKMPKFILPSIRESLARGRVLRLLSLAVAGWFRYLRGEDEKGRAFSIDDPMAEDLRERARRGNADPRPLLALERVFGSELATSAPFVAELERALAALDAKGACATLAEYVSS